VGTHGAGGLIPGVKFAIRSGEGDMCMICSDWSEKRMTNEQAVSNLFEMKEQIGKEHLSEIITLFQGKQTAGEKPGEVILHQNEHGALFILKDKKFADMMMEVCAFAKEHIIICV